MQNPSQLIALAIRRANTHKNQTKKNITILTVDRFNRISPDRAAFSYPSNASCSNVCFFSVTLFTRFRSNVHKHVRGNKHTTIVRTPHRHFQSKLNPLQMRWAFPPCVGIFVWNPFSWLPEPWWWPWRCWCKSKQKAYTLLPFFTPLSRCWSRMVLHPADVSGIKSVYFICTRYVRIGRVLERTSRNHAWRDSRSSSWVLLVGSQIVKASNYMDLDEPTQSLSSGHEPLSNALYFPLVHVWEQNASPHLDANLLFWSVLTYHFQNHKKYRMRWYLCVACLL